MGLAPLQPGQQYKLTQEQLELHGITVGSKTSTLPIYRDSEFRVSTRKFITSKDREDPPQSLRQKMISCWGCCSSMDNEAQDEVTIYRIGTSYLVTRTIKEGS